MITSLIKIEKVRNPRYINIIDQGLSSASSFLLILIIAKTNTTEILASFIMIYGIQLLLAKIHSALITFPLVIKTSSTRSHIYKFKTIAFYYKLNERLTVYIMLIAITLISIIGFFFELSLSTIIIISLFISLSITYEFLRRLYLNTKLIKYHIYLSPLYHSSIIFGIFASVKYLNFSPLMNIILGFSIALFISHLFYFLTRKALPVKIKSKTSLKSTYSIIRNDIGILSNNVTQWLSAQASYYIALICIGPGAVALLGILRSLFGPLNIFLLSMEGFLPKHLGSTKNNKHVFLRKIKTEISILLWIFTFALMFLAVLGETAIYRLYGSQYLESYDINIILILFCLTYLFAAITRVTLISLRILKESKFLRNSSFIILFISILAMIPMATYYDLYGLTATIAISELAIAVMYTAKIIYTFRLKQ